ncbi:MAG: 50S ribosomal protein L25 [Gammaproteobacteria bacterium]|nr:50S ribosomal protein L25 [Gammaproteobacteria bacterium]
MASSKKLFEIEAEIRHELGKGASRRLRREKKLPGVVYGGGKESISLTFEHKNLVKSLENEAFYSHILTLKIGNESEHVVLKDMQRHPYKSQIVHIDLLRVKAEISISMNSGNLSGKQETSTSDSMCETIPPAFTPLALSPPIM